jgi:hypothetical protein
VSSGFSFDFAPRGTTLARDRVLSADAAGRLGGGLKMILRISGDRWILPAGGMMNPFRGLAAPVPAAAG